MAGTRTCMIVVTVGTMAEKAQKQGEEK